MTVFRAGAENFFKKVLTNLKSFGIMNIDKRKENKK